MKNYKINIDKPKPTQEEILSGRNFDDVLKQYKSAPGKVIKKPFWQTTGFVGAVVAVAAAVAVVVYVVNGNNGNLPSDGNGNVISANDNVRQPDSAFTSTWTPTKRSVTPPLAGVNVPFSKYKINSKRGGVFTYPSGTKVKFQAGSFVDANGNVVNGNVEVRYREMHDAVDFFLSGIPMQYDSAGQTWQLESAGMLEVEAFVDGKVVYLDKNKPMEVEFASAYEGTNYNLYKFDTVQGNWVNRGKDEVGMMPAAKVKPDSARRKPPMVNPQDIAGITKPIEPTRPLKADPKNNRFVVDFNKEEFPEMANFTNVIFEVDESKEKFDRGNYNITWESVMLSRGEETGKYNLSLKKGLKQVKLDVYPVLDGEDYKKAMADYQVKYDKYTHDMVLYIGGSIIDSANHVYMGPVVNQGDNDEGGKNEGWVYTAGNDQNSIALTKDVMRTFALDGFGIYNMDVASQLPQGSVINLSLNGPDQQLFSGFTAVYHVDRQKNTVMTYHNLNPMADFHVNTASSNLIWAVKDGELFYTDNENFMALPKSGDATVALKPVGRKLKTADEMKAFFSIGTSVANK